MAVVEMAIVGSLLVFLLFGILMFGYLMSFRQNMTQAAAEGARAGSVAATGSASTDAQAAVVQAVSGFGQHCTGSMSCVVCLSTDPSCPDGQAPPSCSPTPCVRVTVTYADPKNLLPNIPLVSSFMPSTMTAQSIAEINT